MVTIVDYKAYSKENGEDFYALVVQGGLESVKSKETGRTYLTARKATVPCTFDETTCKGLIGSQIPGNIRKEEVEPYEYTVPETGEIIQLQHRYAFVGEEESVLQDNLVESEAVL